MLNLIKTVEKNRTKLALLKTKKNNYIQNFLQTRLHWKNGLFGGYQGFYW